MNATFQPTFTGFDHALVGSILILRAMNNTFLYVCYVSVVEQPCKLGCHGLDYCSNFNDRPTEMFRSCNAEADTGARRDVMLWQSGIILLPVLQELPVKGVCMICDLL